MCVTIARHLMWCMEEFRGQHLSHWPLPGGHWSFNFFDKEKVWPHISQLLPRSSYAFMSMRRSQSPTLRTDLLQARRDDELGCRRFHAAHDLSPACSHSRVNDMDRTLTYLCNQEAPLAASSVHCQWWDSDSACCSSLFLFGQSAECCC